MATIEHGSGILLSVDTASKKLRFQEIRMVAYEGQPPEEECEFPYTLDWNDQQFYDLVGKGVEYVLSDGSVVSLKAG